METIDITPENPETQPKKKGGYRPGAGRKKVDYNINYKAVEAMRACGCTQEEIGDYYGMSRRQMVRLLASDKKLRECFEKGVSKGNISLRRKQWEKAMEGNVGMLIWLGKQYLGQREKVEHSGDQEKPIGLARKDAGTELLNEFLSAIETKKTRAPVIDVKPAEITDGTTDKSKAA